MKYTFEPSRPGDVLLIVGAGVWGKGDTLAAAKEACGWRSTLARNGWTLWSVHADTYVNDWGAMVYPVGHEPMKLTTYS